MMNIVKEHKTGKNKVYLYEDQEFDSKEEIYFYWWLKELKNEGIIRNISRCDSFVLGDKAISGKFTLLDKIIYTPDFKFEILQEKEYFQEINNLDISPSSRKTQKLIYEPSKTCYIEVKADYDNRDKTREVQIKRKWLYHSQGIFVNLVKIPSFFKKTFIPERYRFTDKTLKPRKIKQ